jgi:hypothetical protein
MKTPLLVSISIYILMMSAGCAFGPITAHETARTVGEGHHEFAAGYGQTGGVVKWSYGLSENLDLGLQIESLSQGARIKYAFINNQSYGWSLASAVGAGVSWGGNHQYVDFLASYLAKSWEPYSMLRLVQVHMDSSDWKNAIGNVDIHVDSTQYSYGQVFIGTRYWFTPKFFVSLEATNIFSISAGLSSSNNFLGGATLGYRF